MTDYGITPGFSPTAASGVFLDWFWCTVLCVCVVYGFLLESLVFCLFVCFFLYFARVFWWISLVFWLSRFEFLSTGSEVWCCCCCFSRLSIAPYVFADKFERREIHGFSDWERERGCEVDELLIRLWLFVCVSQTSQEGFCLKRWRVHSSKPNVVRKTKHSRLLLPSAWLKNLRRTISRRIMIFRTREPCSRHHQSRQIT